MSLIYLLSEDYFIFQWNIFMVEMIKFSDTISRKFPISKYGCAGYHLMLCCIAVEQKFFLFFSLLYFQHQIIQWTMLQQYNVCFIYELFPSLRCDKFIQFLMPTFFIWSASLSIWTYSMNCNRMRNQAFVSWEFSISASSIRISTASNSSCFWLKPYAFLRSASDKQSEQMLIARFIAETLEWSNLVWIPIEKALFEYLNLESLVLFVCGAPLWNREWKYEWIWESKGAPIPMKLMSLIYLPSDLYFTFQWNILMSEMIKVSNTIFILI